MTVQDLTVRQKIAEALNGAFLTAREISQAVGIREKEVLDHLPHVARSASSGPDRARFVIQPSSCLSCGFVFRKRERLNTPSRCPVCASEEITGTRYGILKLLAASRKESST